jgi:hydrogenase nickel incorporation protein HypA/HybF
MHELSLGTAIVETAAKHCEGRKVTAIFVNVGGLRQVSPQSLAFYFEFVARGTVCDGARLEQTLIEPRLQCRDCDEEWEVELPVFACGSCGSRRVTIVAGQEFEIDSIEIEIEEEEEEGLCIARG